MGLANLLKVLYQLKDILIVYAPIKRVSKALNPSVQLCLLLWLFWNSGSFCTVQVLTSTKSKKTDSDSVLVTPGIPMRGRSQPAGGEMQSQNLNIDLCVGKKNSLETKNAQNVSNNFRACFRNKLPTNSKI